jgi:hypothetical protein
MTQQEIQSALRTLHDEKAPYISFTHDQDVHLSIEANRNGILKFCDHLLASIDKEHLEKRDTYDIPDHLLDDSNISISVRIQEGKKNGEAPKLSFIQKAGGFLAAAAGIIFLIAGVVQSFKWLVALFD